MPRCGIVPPYLMDRVAAGPDRLAARSAGRTAARDQAIRERRVLVAKWPGEPGQRRGLVPPELLRRTRRAAAETPPSVTAARPAAPDRLIHDAGHGTSLPGAVVRTEGGAAVPDSAVNEAYDGLGATWELLWSQYRRNSLDGQGLRLVASVHYDEEYDNAFWDGVQMVFGDGDGVYFSSFTSCLDVVAHELTHGLTQYTAGLTYVGQSGSLNESVSDVFGSLVKQRRAGQRAHEADWLVGAGLFTDTVHGVALRSMRRPGTAYDDPVLGSDPQPAHMSRFVEMPHDGEHDNGGVHVNSGIPNRAFYLTATALGGYAWERAGQIWYDTLTAGGVPKDLTFATFARRCRSAAATRYGPDSDEVRAVRSAWEEVGVLPAGERESGRRRSTRPGRSG